VASDQGNLLQANDLKNTAIDSAGYIRRLVAIVRAPAA